ncbi:uncharacterized protein LOC116246229 [Nymphaea colorata]|nr:uncharacterized protein LOC116246229 [Nymphaea colorata]
MANPRRSSVSFSSDPPSPAVAINLSLPSPPPQQYNQWSSLLFLKRPHAFPFLLLCFLLLTWVSLKFHHHYHQQQQDFDDPQGQQHQEGRVYRGPDELANLKRYDPSPSSKDFTDDRGWLLNPIAAAQRAGLSGGAQSCVAAHVGQIRPGGVRGNHRHHTCNETFIIWGAATTFRLENALATEKGYAEVTIGADEVAVAASPSGTAHALINVDRARSTYFLGCQDTIISYSNSETDFKIWKDLLVI